MPGFWWGGFFPPTQAPEPDQRLTHGPGKRKRKPRKKR